MDNNWWDQQCLENIKKIGGKPCTNLHCADSYPYLHAICTCQPPYQNGCTGNAPPPNCCAFTASSPVPVFINGDVCYCCCGCFANNTLINSTRDETKPIQDYRVGDLVYVADNATLQSWSEKEVKFSSGTGDYGAFNTMIQVSFGDPDKPEFVIVSRDQLFLLSNRKLKRASKLVPSQDFLVRPDGTAVQVLDMTVGKFKKGVHQIATSTKPTTSMDGHLIVANGLVCGDYSLQISNLDSANSELMVDNHNALPEFGTKEYGQTYSHLLADSYRAHPPDRVVKHPDNTIFAPFGKKGSVRIPEFAEHFVTKEQAKDILEFAPHAPAHSGAGIDITNYLFKLFKGFYPSVVFYLDEENELPNAYAWIEYNVPFVVVNGGLIRTQAVKFESLAFIIGHELGHLFGGVPQNPHGYTCTGMADFSSISAIFPYVWFGIYAAPMIGPAIEQIDKLFSYIQPKHRNGLPGNKCMYISIDCRQKAMEAAANTRPLPECAGGPPDPTLEVLGAQPMQDPNGTYVVIDFNQAVNKETAEMLGNYAFNPLAKSYSANVVDGEPTKVNVKVDLDAGIEYVVDVSGVLSADGHPLVPGKDTAKFQL